VRIDCGANIEVHFKTSCVGGAGTRSPARVPIADDPRATTESVTGLFYVASTTIPATASMTKAPRPSSLQLPSLRMIPVLEHVIIPMLIIARAAEHSEKILFKS